MTEKRRFNVGDPIPAVLTKEELAAGIGISTFQVDRFRKTRSHPGIKQLEAPGHPRFCGRTLKAWIEGGSAEPVTRKFFASARR
jgi:hypothetical protein